MGRNYANKLIASASVVDAVGTIVPVSPATESQARPLSRLEPEQQKEAWQKAVETAPEKLSSRFGSALQNVEIGCE